MEAPKLTTSVRWTPPNLSEGISARFDLLNKATDDLELRAIVLYKCRTDPVYFISWWCWTTDPRKVPAYMPFILFPRQAEYIEWLVESIELNEGGLVEKSRDMGLTWLCVGFAVWLWLFRSGSKVAFGSRKEALVDKKGDPDCIFEKIRFILDRLPGWMLPTGFNRKAHDNFLRLTNPENGNSITGEGGDNMGRGGRSTIYFKDESAFYERPQLAEAAISQNTDVPIDVSTPNGIGNPFHTKRAGGKVRVFTFHWTDDPRKDAAWYKRMVNTLDALIVAQEIDIDYAASVERIVIPRGWAAPSLARKLYDDERGALVIGGDVAEGGADRSAAVVREGRNVLHLSEWSDPNGDLSAGQFIALGLEYEQLLDPWHYVYFFIDSIGVGAGTVGAIRNYAKDKGKKQWVIVGVKVSETSPDPKCHRLKDALWWRMRDWFEDDEPAITAKAPEDLRNKLISECATPQYDVPNGLIEIESKKLMKKRGVASPNLADALMHTFWSEQFKKQEPRPEWVKGMKKAGGGWTM